MHNGMKPSRVDGLLEQIASSHDHQVDHLPSSSSPLAAMRPRKDSLARLQNRAVSKSFNKPEQIHSLHPGLRSPGLELKRIEKYADDDRHNIESPARKPGCDASDDSESGDECGVLKKPQLIKLQPISKQLSPAHPNSKFKSPSCNARSKSFCVRDTRVSKSSQEKKSPEVL